MERKFKTGQTVICTQGAYPVRGKIIFAYTHKNEWVYTLEGGGHFGDTSEKYLKEA